MPHRPLFVLRCHHFSPVIYFIAISVSLPPSPSPSPPSLQCLSSFFTCALPSPPPSPSSPAPLVARSFFLPHPPYPPRCAPCLQTPRSKLSTTQRNTIPLSSPSWRLYYTFLSPSRSLLLPFLSRGLGCRFSFSLSLALPRTGGISTTMLSVRKREREGGEEREERAR